MLTASSRLTLAFLLIPVLCHRSRGQDTKKPTPRPSLFSFPRLLNGTPHTFAYESRQRNQAGKNEKRFLSTRVAFKRITFQITTDSEIKGGKSTDKTRNQTLRISIQGVEITASDPKAFGQQPPNAIPQEFTGRVTIGEKLDRRSIRLEGIPEKSMAWEGTLMRLVLKCTDVYLAMHPSLSACKLQEGSTWQCGLLNAAPLIRLAKVEPEGQLPRARLEILMSEELGGENPSRLKGNATFSSSGLVTCAFEVENPTDSEVKYKANVSLKRLSNKKE